MTHPAPSVLLCRCPERTRQTHSPVRGRRRCLGRRGFEERRHPLERRRELVATRPARGARLDVRLERRVPPRLQLAVSRQQQFLVVDVSWPVPHVRCLLPFPFCLLPCRRHSSALSAGDRSRQTADGAADRLGHRSKRNAESGGDLAIAQTLGSERQTLPIAIRQGVEHRDKAAPLFPRHQLSCGIAGRVSGALRHLPSPRRFPTLPSCLALRCFSARRWATRTSHPRRLWVAPPERRCRNSATNASCTTSSAASGGRPHACTYRRRPGAATSNSSRTCACTRSDDGRPSSLRDERDLERCSGRVIDRRRHRRATPHSTRLIWPPGGAAREKDSVNKTNSPGILGVQGCGCRHGFVHQETHCSSQAPTGCMAGLRISTVRTALVLGVVLAAHGGVGQRPEQAGATTAAVGTGTCDVRGHGHRHDAAARRRGAADAGARPGADRDGPRHRPQRRARRLGLPQPPDERRVRQRRPEQSVPARRELPRLHRIAAARHAAGAVGLPRRRPAEPAVRRGRQLGPDPADRAWRRRR